MRDLWEENSAAIAANAFSNYNHIVVEDIQPDAAAVYLDIVPESRNPFGNVHGGALFTLADVCAGVTARTDGRCYVTQAASVQFLRGAKEGRVTARGSVIRRGRTVCIIEVRITDADGELLFLGTFTFFCTSR